MERPKKAVITLLLVSVFVIPTAGRPQSGNSGDKESLIRERLMSDIREVRKQLSQLTETVDQLQSEVDRLNTDNERQKARIKMLEQLVNRLRETGKSPNIHKPESSDKPQKSQEKTKSSREETSQDTVWTSSSDFDYKIRKSPLDKETTYVTTYGTTLTKLAHRYYRDASFWKEIYRINRDKLPAPNEVPEGVRLRLPPVDKLR